MLDNGATPRLGTLLCVHGNPTWSYLWRHLLAALSDGWRVVAPDHLGMGFSERTDSQRSLAQRVADLTALTETLGIEGPVVTVAHDWGGPISLGWALAHRDRVRGVVLANTAVHQPGRSAPPALIRLARTPVLRDGVCVSTPVFVRSATALSRRPLADAVRDAFAAPYGTTARRHAVGDFVADIPLESDHPSAAALGGIRDGLPHLADVPVLLLWGPCDPVFSDRYLCDLLSRLPHADVQRYEGASHLVTEDAPRSADAIARWVEDLDEVRTAPPASGHGRVTAGSNFRSSAGRTAPATTGQAPFWAALTDRAVDPATSTSTAIVELGPRRRRVTFGQLEAGVRDLAVGLAATGVRAGDRVAMLVPPGPELAAALYACWRIGAVVVIADAGLGVRPLGRALRGAGPNHVIGIARGLAAAAVLRVPGRRIMAGSSSPEQRRALGVTHTLGDLARLGHRGHSHLPVPQLVADGRPGGTLDNHRPPIAGTAGDTAGPGDDQVRPGDDDECAVIFTSGATGPAKGVVYRHRQVRAQLAALRSTYGITSDDRLVAAFAPFALYGPLLGIASAVPDVDVTAPAGLTAVALADAAAAVDATLVFASPSALRNVVETAHLLRCEERAALARVRLVLSAGAPVPLHLLRRVQAVLPGASLHTPYGMTEALPVADISLEQIEAAGAGNGVCVGHPIDGVDIAVSPLTATGDAPGTPITTPEITGEVCVRAAHVKDRYDRLWATERASSRNAGWHRTSDVGHLDGVGRLWVEGRLAHIVVTASGPVTPVGIEQRIEQIDGVRAAAVVGVGPRGTQQVVVVVVPESTSRRSGVLADEQLATAVRDAAGTDVTAVLVTSQLPVDIRHQSKIDRAKVAAWADRVLAGGRARRRP